MSPRGQSPLRPCVLSALDDALASDELFGHVPGAFTGARDVRAGVFASATGGTVFLDEIGKASLHVQQKLLDAIESHVIVPLGSDRPVTVDVRIIAAANIPLRQLVDEMKFLPDLYARLKSFRIALPPLRERREDIPLLVEQCVAYHARDCGYESVPQVDDELMSALKRAEWPHNLRELDGTVHRLVVEAEGAALLTVGHCVDDLSFLVASPKPKAAPNAAAVREAVARIKKKSAAARELGTSRSTLYRRLEELATPASEHSVS
jgi:DNA-binding NtrC family response regulator